MKTLIVLLYFVSICHATDIENYFGKYRTESQKKGIQFTFDIYGIKELKIEGNIIKSKISYDIMGIYGGTLFLKIEIKGENNEFGVINILILKEKEFIISSGYYLWAKSLSEGEYKVKNKFAFSLKYEEIE